MDECNQDCLLTPGIHAILPLDAATHPTTFKTRNSGALALRVVLFYWPVDDAFDIPSMGSRFRGICRSNVSCLYLRILHEITDCVMVSVSKQEVKC